MKDKIFLLVIVVMSCILALLPTGFENKELIADILYEKSEVLEANNDELESFSIVTTGTQMLTLKVLSGKFKGDTLHAYNILTGQKKLDKIFKEGDKVLTVIQMNEDKTECISARADDFYRKNVEIILFLCFALFLLLFAKITGFKAIVSFVFTALAFWKLLLPAFLKCYSPILVSLGVLYLCSCVVILLVAGLNKRGLVALLGCFAGVGITALLALLFGYFFKIPGTVQEYSEALLYTGFAELNLSDMFIATIFISSTGAVMDIAMDISASQAELIRRKPDLSGKELMISGFRIAAPVIGSMTTTLLFAYSGTFLFAFMAFMAKGTPFISITNTSYIAAEILHTLVGSFGLVLVAPLTAIIGSKLFKR